MERILGQKERLDDNLYRPCERRLVLNLNQSTVSCRKQSEFVLHKVQLFAYVRGNRTLQKLQSE